MNLHDKADEILRTVISKNNEVLEQQQKFHKKETARLDKLTFITLENQRMLEAAFRTQNIKARTYTEPKRSEINDSKPSKGLKKQPTRQRTVGKK